MQDGEPIPLIARARLHGERVALVDEHGALTYRALLEASARAAAELRARGEDLAGARIALLAPPGAAYVIWQWAIWRAGGVAVPLCTSHPAPELEYVLDDAGASAVVVHPQWHALIAPSAGRRGLRVLSTAGPDADPGSAAAHARLPHVAAERGAMLLYTSGTTGKPKGVLSTHANLAAQIESLIAAWEWSARDRVLHVLPLHHLHGILNALCCALWAGACCEFLPRFEAERVLDRIADSTELTLLMAVPTMYAKLADAWDRAEPERRSRISARLSRLRLMVSGSAALPVAMLERWHAISGHVLLERYGMTEFGMGLGQPLHGERRPGHVGIPFPGIDVRLVDERLAPVPDGEPGQLQVRGPGVFQQYWQRPEATREAFTADGWFKTGDIALRERGMYRILGRESVDILKTGGYKVSALEIEDALREHPAIAECAVVGVPDAQWGQRVAAAVVLRQGAALELDALRAWGKARLAPYKVPTVLRLVPALPRNAMGKVQKPEIIRMLTSA